MSKETFLLIAISYYLITIIIIVIVLAILNKKNRQKILNEINSLEREKNLIISASILSELNKVEALINNDELKNKYEEWYQRFNDIKDKEIPKITDEIIEIEDEFNEKKYKNIEKDILNAESTINL